MRISSLKQCCSYVLHAILYTAAALIVTIAIVFSIARVITPYLNTHKDQLAQWGSHLLDTRITIGNVDLAWQGINPLVKLNDVHFYNPVTNALIAELNNIQIGVDIIQSLWKRTFEPGTVCHYLYRK